MRFTLLPAKLAVAICAFMAVLGVSRSASAQYWLQDRALSEGRGVRTGDFEFHFGLGLEFGYDSNVFAAPNNEIPALRLRGTAHVALSTLGTQRMQATTPSSAFPTVVFRAQLAVWWNQFFGVPGNMDPNSQPGAALNGPGGILGFHLHVFPGRTFQFLLYDDLQRIAQGGTDYGTNLFVYDRWLNAGGFGLVYAPNGGVLDVRLTYDNTLTVFNNAGYSIYNSDSNQIALRSRWRFLPKTALLWEGIINPSLYVSNTTTSPTGLYSSFPITTRIGINGLLTDKIGLLFMLGWTSTNFVAGDNASTPVGQLEFRYILGPTSSFALGFIRDVNPSLVGNYYIRDALYVQLAQSFSGRFYLSGKIEGGRLDYGYISNNDATGSRATNYTGTSNFDPNTGRWSSWRILGLLFGEYRPSDVVGINATLTASSNITDVQLPTTTSTGGMTTVGVSWTKFEAFLGVRVNW